MTPRTRTQPRPTPLRSPQRAIELFLAAAGLAVLLVAPSLVTGTYVPRLTIENRTQYDVNVEVAGGGQRAWLDLGTVPRETEGVLEEISDPGGTWVIRFSHGGVEVGELTVTRAELRDADWKLVVPTEVGDRLTEAGASPSAR